MKKGPKDRDSEKLVQQLDQLGQLSAEELIKQWQALFGVAPPKNLRSSLLVQGIAYRLQEKALGGLKLRLCVCWNESPTIPPQAGQFLYPRQRSG
jgi:Protein of unknown function (DUF2924)